MRYFVDPPPEIADDFFYPCGICDRGVGLRARALQCDICNFWNHIRCDGVEPSFYEKLKKSKDDHYCKLCREEHFPFQKLPNEEYMASVVHGVHVDDGLDLDVDPPPRLRVLFNELNDRNENSPINCEYYDYSKPVPGANNKNKAIFHMNIASLNLHREELETALSLLNFEFDVIGITETKFMKGVAPIVDPSLSGYSHYHTPTESSKGGALVYVRDSLTCNRRSDLEGIMYKSKLLESVFIEIENVGKKNQIYGCIYRHPGMDVDTFNVYLNKLLGKLDSEKKVAYLMGDFNMDLLKTESDEKIGKYYDILSRYLFVPHITLPTRITSNSKTLIDNIFSNDLDFSIGVPGNFTFSISDHLPQFLLMPGGLGGLPKKHNIFRRKKNYSGVDIVADSLAIDWAAVLRPDGMDPNYSFNKFYEEIVGILDRHAPLKKVSKKDFKLESKPWITPGILNSIRRRDSLLRRFIKAPEGSGKDELHTQYRVLRNKIVALVRLSKNNHYRTYFTNNAEDIKKTWRGIKSIINLKATSGSFFAFFSNCADNCTAIIKLRR